MQHWAADTTSKVYLKTNWKVLKFCQCNEDICKQGTEETGNWYWFLYWGSALSGAKCPGSRVVDAAEVSAPKAWQSRWSSLTQRNTWKRPYMCLSSALLCSARWLGGHKLHPLDPGCSSINSWVTLNRYDKEIIREALQFVRCLVKTTVLLLLLLLGLTGWLALAWEN